MQLIKEEQLYTYRYLEALSLLEVVWHGSVSASELQESLQEVAAILKEKEINYFLVDERLSRAAKATDETWIRAFYMPLLGSTSIKRFARLACPTDIQQHIVSGIISAINQEHQYRFGMKTFRDKEDAMEWLFTTEPLKEQMPYRGDCRAFSLI
ncbi:STAS/SEC14 domain-containing protein [Pontibacter cellulosilyticus]|uniref:STAS/SEC14 domain-containing protein n=1 Tax=Pontibacter cellulosilyticus TaxID=1720253 RepID=A0A923N7K1_9BACT|nr:STAS/SEC14 domain-containing protein [Pontibacter cellulosilyticus]MBC5994365.1 STAS/SEC14 domain-containing protein [Pontibacter cellulosilyticus]